jgi:hypothetical protein
MRWTKRYPKCGDIKRIKKFLWFPLNDDGDIRWLEFANCKYEYIEYYFTKYDKYVKQYRKVWNLRWQFRGFEND